MTGPRIARSLSKNPAALAFGPQAGGGNLRVARSKRVYEFAYAADDFLAVRVGDIEVRHISFN